MKAVFADTSFFLAALNPADELHDKAITLSRQTTALRVTTGFVLLEVANALSRAGQRLQFLAFHTRLKDHPQAHIIPVSQELWDRGYGLYARREDKDWSLTDCISFIVMSDTDLSEALSHDHHFEQAGYTALLR